MTSFAITRKAQLKLDLLTRDDAAWVIDVLVNDLAFDQHGVTIVEIEAPGQRCRCFVGRNRGGPPILIGLDRLRPRARDP